MRKLIVGLVGLVLLFAVLSAPSVDAGVLKYRFQVLDSSADPTARIPVFFSCDTEAELPSTGVGEADLAYAKDTDKLFKRTGVAWVEIGSTTGSGTANTVAKWTGTSTLGNSTVTDDGTVVTANTATTFKATVTGTSATSNFFRTDGTLATTNTDWAIGNLMTIASAGSSNNRQEALSVFLNPGYTGPNLTVAGFFTNNAVGTGAFLLSSGLANFGIIGETVSTTTGTNAGGSFAAIGGNRNYGLVSSSVSSKASATNIGSLAVAANSGAGGSAVGIYAGLYTAEPTLPASTKAAAVFDNQTNADPIALFWDNGTEVFSVQDGGNLRIADSALDHYFTIARPNLAADRTLNLPLITGTDTLAVLGLAQTFSAANTFTGGVTVNTSALTISGVEADFEGGAAEGFPRLAQSITPPAASCDATGEAGRLYFDSDADVDGSVFVCTGAGGWKDIDDDGAGGGGDSIRVEDGDNAGTFTAMTDADFDDSGDINFTRTAGPPDVLTATVRPDSIALTTDTTGNYAAGDAEAGAALTGDSATAFFSVGTLEVTRGGTGSAPGADDQVLVSDSTSAATWRSVPGCTIATQKLIYNTASNTWTCETDATGSGSSNFTEVEIDFGAAGDTNIAKVVTVEAWVSSTSKIMCAPTALSTADRPEGSEDAVIEGLTLSAHTRVAGTGFTLNAAVAEGKGYGKFKIHCVWS